MSGSIKLFEKDILSLVEKFGKDKFKQAATDIEVIVKFGVSMTVVSLKDRGGKYDTPSSSKRERFKKVPAYSSKLKIMGVREGVRHKVIFCCSNADDPDLCYEMTAAEAFGILEQPDMLLSTIKDELMKDYDPRFEDSKDVLPEKVMDEGFGSW